jgi:hypothetical protein
MENRYCVPTLTAGRPKTQEEISIVSPELLGLYEKWEAGQVLCGLKTARQIEKSLRWDEKTAFNGRGCEVLSAQRWQADDASVPVLGTIAR